jgi:hypothetical protein
MQFGLDLAEHCRMRDAAKCNTAHTHGMATATENTSTLHDRLAGLADLPVCVSITSTVYCWDMIGRSNSRVDDATAWDL